MPWMVAFFGILVIPLGLTHIVLVISQPVLVHAWCAGCILAALIMLPMIPLELGEVGARGEHMIQAERRGDRGGSLWTIFWKGGSAEGCTPDERTPAMAAMHDRPWQVFLSSIWGMSFPWTLSLAAILGVAMMLSPTLFGISIESIAGDIGHLGGALIVTISVICLGEVIRAGRYLNIPLGLAVAIMPWLVSGSSTPYALTCSVLGVAVMGLAIPRGPQREQYGLWNRFVR